MDYLPLASCAAIRCILPDVSIVWLCLAAVAISRPFADPQSFELAPPAYSARSILPSGASHPGPLAPGMLASIYGERLGPETACTGSADPRHRETPNSLRPNQTMVETQVFPKRLCDTEVRVGGVAAGLLYVQARQINFKVPQDVPVKGTTGVRVTYKGQSGPVVMMDLASTPRTESAPRLAETIWSGLQRVKWETAYEQRAGKRASVCSAVPVHPDLRGGLYGHAYYCSEQIADVVAESFYYPAGGARPVVLLRRADFRLAIAYPEMSAEVEQLLLQRLVRTYGPGTVPDHLFEIGASRPNPGLSWRAGDTTIFLHRNRNFVAPAGVREGVQLIAVRTEVLAERESKREIDKAFGSTTKLAHSMIVSDVKKDLGPAYLLPGRRPTSEAERAASEHETRVALLALLGQTGAGDRSRRAAILVAADDLTVRLGSLLVARSVAHGAETLSEAPGASRARRQLAAYGVRYTGIGHYSGDLEYDRSLLRRAGKEFPETPWGQRAFLVLQCLSCSISGFGCQGPNCFRAVIEQGENFLREHPGTPFRKEQIYNLALAYETWWSLSQAGPGDPSAEGAQVDRASAERARKKAIELYEELARIAPESPEARAGRLILPRLKLRLGTGERTFFCFSC